MAEERFQAFDWLGSEAWKAHIRNVFPEPSTGQMQRMKRKWFREHIDASLTIEPVPSPIPTASPTAPSAQLLPPALLFSLWPIALFLGKGMSFSLLASSLGLLCTYGFPQRSKAYWLPVLRDDALHTVIFSLIYMYYTGRVVVHLPVAVAAAVWCVSGLSCEEIPAKVRLWAQKVEKRKWVLLKQDLEVAIGVYLVLSILTPWGSIFEMILYWQYLRIKYVLSPYLQVAFHNLKHFLDPLLAGRAVVGTAWQKLQQFGAYMVSTERKQSTTCDVM